MFNAFAVSTVQIASQRVANTWPWYVVRGAGFAAAGLLVLLMISGIGQVTGLTYRFIEPIKAWAVHRALAIALCFAIATHVIFLLFDHFVKFSLVQVLVPFASHYKRSANVPLGSLWVACGIVAAYLVAIVVASSLGWINSRKGAWRKLHYLNYVIVVLVFFHALYAGSDLAYGMFRAAWIFVGVLLIISILTRLMRTGTMRRSKGDGQPPASSR